MSTSRQRQPATAMSVVEYVLQRRLRHQQPPLSTHSPRDQCTPRQRQLGPPRQHSLSCASRKQHCRHFRACPVERQCCGLAVTWNLQHNDRHIDPRMSGETMPVCTKHCYFFGSRGVCWERWCMETDLWLVHSLWRLLVLLSLTRGPLVIHISTSMAHMPGQVHVCVTNVAQEHETKVWSVRKGFTYLGLKKSLTKNVAQVGVHCAPSVQCDRNGGHQTGLSHETRICCTTPSSKDMCSVVLLVNRTPSHAYFLAHSFAHMHLHGSRCCSTCLCEKRSSTCHHVSDRSFSLHPLISSSLSSVSTSCPMYSPPLFCSSSMWSEQSSNNFFVHTQNEEYGLVAIQNPLT